MISRLPRMKPRSHPNVIVEPSRRPPDHFFDFSHAGMVSVLETFTPAIFFNLQIRHTDAVPVSKQEILSR